LPSWRDLAAQLGVARGTVRAAYERLIDEQLVITSGPAGTHVADQPPATSRDEGRVDKPVLAEMFRDFSTLPGIFQVGVPAQDAFPFKSWSRLMARSARLAAAAPVSYPDPRGELELRREIAAYLAIARGIVCTPAQILVTAGYAGALGLASPVLGLDGKTGWMEEPGYPIARTALKLAGARPVPVPVDAEGLDVAAGMKVAPDASFALVTPGQQAPLGVTLSLARRRALLDWAEHARAWIIEDDYLSELQLTGRAAPALASLDRAGRVIHIGTFSKTISPTLRLGFIVAPPGLAAQFADVAACLAPAPATTVQHAVAAFLHEGHYLRHLRRMKRLYAGRRDALKRCLGDAAMVEAMAGLAVLLHLPDDTRDANIAREALAFGMSPSPLSPWYAKPGSRSAGLLLGVTNVPERNLASYCTRLEDLIAKYG
jgi:GntR family transcriptional regulator/MocR family aminotransferase